MVLPLLSVEFGVAGQDIFVDFFVCFSYERRKSCDKDISEDANGPEIAFEGVFAFEDFRSDVVGSPDFVT